ncbi:hypothetical protein E2562_016135 [Oryza meyeriana var. granulata]|uniref:Uncharacterized protein n=1 Tax=Oryza meyeriana var. granulata TaxID=110450 RepID=A0A6G1F8D5_9ORYZ|nr:hypothetical protein E2562_016135 [Oryza meyeriana var. granulata]
MAVSGTGARAGEKCRRVEDDHQDREDREQRHLGEKRGVKHRRVGRDHQDREQRGRRVERGHLYREQRGYEEAAVKPGEKSNDADGEPITISNVERSFEFEGRLVGRRLVDADYQLADKKSTHKEHKKRQKRRHRDVAILLLIDT